MKEEPDQALPITAGLVSTTALYAMMWCLADGWMDRPGWESMGLPGLFMDENMRTVVSYFVPRSRSLSLVAPSFAQIYIHTSFGRILRDINAHAPPPTGIGRPVDGRRFDIDEFLHRNHRIGTRTELRG